MRFKEIKATPLESQAVRHRSCLQTLSIHLRDLTQVLTNSIIIAPQATRNMQAINRFSLSCTTNDNVENQTYNSPLI